MSNAELWRDTVKNYKQALVHQLTQLVTAENLAEPVAELAISDTATTKVYVEKVETSIHGNLSSISLRFHPTGALTPPLTVSVDIALNPGQVKTVQGVPLLPLVACMSLPIEGGNVARRNNILLIEPVDDPTDDAVRWRESDFVLNAGTKGVADMPLYAKKWFSVEGRQEPAMKFVGALEGIKLLLQQQTFSVFCPIPLVTGADGERSLEMNLSLPLIESILNSIALIHAKALVARAINWVVLATFDNKVRFKIKRNGSPAEYDDSAKVLGLIQPDDYNQNPKRPVDLSPFELKRRCEEKEKEKLYFSWNVYQTICTSLNLGRHLILTGPPGCGKTKLAILVARLISERGELSKDAAEPLVVTASPAWTSGDLIGRYFPEPPDDFLRFQQGFFLRALEEDRCLVIDEMNRANLDECFGELFTVLSGHAVNLPYKELSENELGTVRIVPRNDNSVAPAKSVIYEMSQTFRLIGTMNDADRSVLHQLSFALLRRFDVVRIDPPSIESLQILLNSKLPNGTNFEIYTFQGVSVNVVRNIARDRIKVLMESIFFQGVDSIITKYVVGVATLLDCLAFVLEGLRPNSTYQGSVNIGYLQGGNRENVVDFITSLTTLALILTVIPQLDALDSKKFRDTVTHLKVCLGERPYLRLNLVGETLELVQEGGQTVSGFLLNEIKRATRGTQHAEIVDDLA